MDWALDPSHDLSNPQRQESVRDQLQEAVFAAAALDCSTKSRAQEIPRNLGDGKPWPRPLRSDRYPEGIPDLPMAEQLRVSKNNLACSFVLTELQALADRGGGSVRENPLRSLHWELTQEKQMMATGLWQDTVYSACSGARPSACATTLMRLPVGPISSAITHMRPMSGSPTFRMGSVFSPPRSGQWSGASSDSPGRAGKDPAAEASGGCHSRGQDPATWGRLRGTRPPQPSPPSYQMELSVCPRPGHNCDPSSWLPLYVEHVMQHLAGDLPELTGCVLAPNATSARAWPGQLPAATLAYCRNCSP